MKLMLAGKLKFEHGKILLTDRYMTWLPLDTLKIMTLDAEKKGKRGLMQLYFYAWHFGFITTLSYMRTFKTRPFEETFKLIMDVATMFGYGEYQTLDFKRKLFSKFKNIGNPFGLLFYPTPKKVCHFIRGANAGGGAALHGVIMNGIELECTANNNQYCLFMNVANPLLESKYPEITKEQLDLKWLLEKQLDVVKENKLDPKSFLEFEKTLA